MFLLSGCPVFPDASASLRIRARRLRGLGRRRRPCNSDTGLPPGSSRVDQRGSASLRARSLPCRGEVTPKGKKNPSPLRIRPALPAKSLFPALAGRPSSRRKRGGCCGPRPRAPGALFPLLTSSSSRSLQTPRSRGVLPENGHEKTPRNLFRGVFSFRSAGRAPSCRRDRPMR